jgi:enoyl-CoA hydratase/carnithine racemase
LRGVLQRLLVALVVVLVAALAMAVVVGVVFRKAGAPLVWYDEVASILLAWLTYYGAALAALWRAHIGFPKFVQAAPPPLRRALTLTREAAVIGFFLSAAEALQKGLLTRVVADGEVIAEALAAAGRITAGAPLVARWHKQWVHRLMDTRPLTEAERHAAFAFLDTEDYSEGLAAFLAKRKPDFKGR